MLRTAKFGTLRFLKTTGAFERVRDSRWRSERLLILCYHGISIDDEHEWRSKLYMPPAMLRERFESLRRGGYRILPLDEALQRLYKNDLPPRSVVLTFDDGGYDFYRQANPILQEFGYPATVYQTTHYSDYPWPIFHVAASYVLWKRRSEVLQANHGLGLPAPTDLRSENSRGLVIAQVEQFCVREGLTPYQQNEVLARLADSLGFDYRTFVIKRLLQIMHPTEIAEMARAGFDIQLHTHRHRAPLDEVLFRKEIADNRKRICEATGGKPTHFCYPSGHYETSFIPWLEQEGITSATTCDPGLASRRSNRLLLPRFVDTMGQPLYVFESWLCGAGHLVSRRRPAAHALASERDAA